jgi:hypothetical protein
MIRRVAGGILLITGLWLAWGSAQWLFLYTSRGAPLGEAVSDPVFLMPGLRALAAILGGGLALLAWRGGAWLAGVATAIAAILLGLILAAGGDSSLWMGKLVSFALIGILFFVLAFTHREDA